VVLRLSPTGSLGLRLISTSSSFAAQWTPWWSLATYFGFLSPSVDRPPISELHLYRHATGLSPLTVSFPQSLELDLGVLWACSSRRVWGLRLTCFVWSSPCCIRLQYARFCLLGDAPPPTCDQVSTRARYPPIEDAFHGPRTDIPGAPTIAGADHPLADSSALTPVRLNCHTPRIRKFPSDSIAYPVKSGARRALCDRLLRNCNARPYPAA